MQQFTAFVRKPGLSFPQALSKHPRRNDINLAIALNQHDSYVDALKETGVVVKYLPSQDHLPDATFVEDTAVILENKFLLCPMKELTRQTETQFTSSELGKYLEPLILDSISTLDGGDVMDTPDTIFVGLSKRTNLRAIQALSKLTSKKVVPVAVTKGLHLKSATTFLGNNLLIIDPTRVDSSNLKHFDWIEVNPSESYSANCLAFKNAILMPAGFPNVRDKIHAQGLKTLELEMSEFEKADGGITCLSIIIPPQLNVH